MNLYKRKTAIFSLFPRRSDEEFVKPTFYRLYQNNYNLFFVKSQRYLKNKGGKQQKMFRPQQGGRNNILFGHNFSSSSSHSCAEASEGMRQSPRGESETEPTLAPSGMQERLNCWEKNLL